MAEWPSGIRLAQLARSRAPSTGVELPAPRRSALAEGTTPPSIAAYPPPSDRASRARLEHLLIAISRARTPRGVADALLANVAWIACRGAIFLRVRGELRGFAGRGRSVSKITLSRARLALGSPSILGYLTSIPTSYRGRIHHDIRSRDFLIDALGSVPDEITAFSITARGRVLGVGYADGVYASLEGDELAQLGRQVGQALLRTYRAATHLIGRRHDEGISH